MNLFLWKNHQQKIEKICEGEREEGGREGRGEGGRGRREGGREREKEKDNKKKETNLEVLDENFL